MNQNKKTIKVWLDDIRKAPKEWIWIKTAQEAIDMLEQENVDVISLDYDLGKNMENGNYVFNWIKQETFMNPLYIPPEIIIHSKNNAGIEKMTFGANIINQERIKKLENPPDLEAYLKNLFLKQK
jgi:hypothetical protein